MLDQEQRAAINSYPAVLVADHLVHVYKDSDGWKVWLNCNDMEFTGLCIGFGQTRDDACAQAVAALEACAHVLQQPV